MKQYGFVSCPYCSHSLVEAKFKRAKFDIAPLEYKIYTQREQRSQKGFPRGQGKGHRGFYMIEGSGKNILQLMDGSKEEAKIAVAIVDRIKKIYEAYESVGLIP